jgi:hypothetical protein
VNKSLPLKEMDSEESGKKKMETIFVSLGFFEDKKENSKSINIRTIVKKKKKKKRKKKEPK